MKINDLENRKLIVNLRTKSWFFERTDKIETFICIDQGKERKFKLANSKTAKRTSL